MSIKAACSRVGVAGSNDPDSLVTELAAQLAKEAAAVAKACGITQHKVYYESVGVHTSSNPGSAGTDGPCLSDIGPTFLKSKEHRHWYNIGQSSSHYEAHIAEQNKQNNHSSSSSSGGGQHCQPTNMMPAVLIKQVMVKQQEKQQHGNQQSNAVHEVGQPNSARSTNSTSSSNSTTCAVHSVANTPPKQA